MEKSKHSEEVLNLGKQLVKEFSDHGRGDQTTSWMAHYLSEIIHKAENEKIVSKKRILQKECSELILELWKKRSYSPGRHKPLSELSDAVEILSALKKEEVDPLSWRQYIGREDNSSWGKFMRHTRSYMENTLALCLSITAGRDILKREKRWLKNDGLLSDEEKKIIQDLDYLMDNTYSKIRIIFEPEENSKADKERLAMAFDKLSELAKAQVKRVEEFKGKFITAKPDNISKSKRKTVKP